jgi:ribosome-binding protein aMBF1 (putative translation factor)
MALMLERNAASTPQTVNDAPITPEQVGTARRLLGWSASRLGARVGVSAKTILAFEAGDRWSAPLYLDLVRKRLEIEGVEFIADLNGAPAVRLTKGRKSARHISNSANAK